MSERRKLLVASLGLVLVALSLFFSLGVKPRWDCEEAEGYWGIVDGRPGCVWTIK